MKILAELGAKNGLQVESSIGHDGASGIVSGGRTVAPETENHLESPNTKQKTFCLR